MITITSGIISWSDVCSTMIYFVYKYQIVDIIVIFSVVSTFCTLRSVFASICAPNRLTTPTMIAWDQPYLNLDGSDAESLVLQSEPMNVNSPGRFVEF